MSTRSEPTVVSLFSGCGGSSLGYKQAGYRVLLAADCDPHAVATYRLNFDSTPVWDRDVAGLTTATVRDLTGLEVGELDVLDGSPPCQGFSHASGKVDTADERNFLFREYVRLLESLRPRAMVMENVTGLIHGKHRWTFTQIHRALEGAGYTVRARVLNAARFGVPQARERVIFIGVRSDLGVAPSHPGGTDHVITCAEAFDGLPVDDSRTLGAFGLQVWKRTPPGRLFNKKHPFGWWFTGAKLHPDRPARTLTKTLIQTGGGGLFHWKHPRCLNEGELRRVSSFPDDFKVEGGLVKTWARFGNAVPPKMMEAVATTVRERILEAA